MIKRILLIVTILLLCAANAQPVFAAQPTASAPIHEGGQATTFRASGTIDLISRSEAAVVFFANEPFWGPPRSGEGEVYLWPKDTAFVLFVPVMIPITIDGKKGSFRNLMVGQKISVQYNMRAGGISCIANRIDGHSPASRFVSDGQSHTPQLIGHWRSLRREHIDDFWFAADGTFRNEIARRGQSTYIIKGTWWTDGDQLRYVVTESNDPDYRAGTKDHDKLLILTKDEYAIETIRGNQYHYARLKG